MHTVFKCFMVAIIRICRITQKSFIISDEDQAFYQRMDVPLPTISPAERMRRRLSYRNECFLYHRKCSLTGKQIISSASPEKLYPVYDVDAWWSDAWGSLSYGIDFDFNRPFFEQFFALRDRVPRMALQQQKPMENSQYCNCASRNKNCYLVFSTNSCEDCYYGSWINFSKDCIDNENSTHNELCYETVDCQGCYNVIYAEESKNCSDSAFIKNCNSCQYCLFSTNLQNKKYYIFNKLCTKDEYEKLRTEMRTGSFEKFEEYKAQFADLKRNMVVKCYYGTQNENVTGNYINNSKNTFDSYECVDCEDVRYVNNVEEKVKDCMDYGYWGNNASQIYECQACGYDLYNLRFCNLCWSNCADLTYCDHCFSSQNCFGCVGLKQKQYCIFNKQYTKEEYEDLLSRIIAHMQKKGEWGEFFPAAKSPFAYNESLAQEWFPLTKQQAIARGYDWQEEEKSPTSYEGPVFKIPDSIRAVDDSITKQILFCECTGRPYKVISQELVFYQKMGLPIPRRCPDQRHLDRMARRNPRKLWNRQCAQCGTSLQTTYAPDRPEKIYCESCYLKAVY